MSTRTKELTRALIGHLKEHGWALVSGWDSEEDLPLHSPAEAVERVHSVEYARLHFRSCVHTGAHQQWVLLIPENEEDMISDWSAPHIPGAGTWQESWNKAMDEFEPD